MEPKNKTFFIIVICTIFLTGILGLLSFSLLYLFSELNLGKDSINKHGISPGTSRLGGLVIIISSIIGFFLKTNLDNSPLSNNISWNNLIVIFSILIGSIGLAEDLSQKISFSVRLFSILSLVVISLLVLPMLVPTKLPVIQIFSLQESYIIVFCFTAFMILGFINAGNIADGANGLLSIISLLFFVVVYSLNHDLMYLSLIISLLSFSLYNIFTGKIFLGDFGAYALSAFIAYSSLYLYAMDQLGVFFIASILVYPCYEISRSVIFRILNKTSIFHPDNEHLHNYINTYILSFGIDRHTSNSLTGVAIALFTSGIPLIIFFSGVSPKSSIWLIIFSIQIIILVFLFLFFASQKYPKKL
ncbi:MAG: hypothetical protein CMD58_00005 [Gammaproteobacteria bacterium]|nr:hypothetical protein [Gammaproteobacteria bacterium]